MEILITSKTHKGNTACVGGIILHNNSFVRLLNSGNQDQPADTDLKVGDIWNIEFDNRRNVIPPHIEDILIKSKRYLRSIGNVSNYIKTCGVQIFHGSPTNLFNKALKWSDNGSGYLEDKFNLPNNSVGFWLSDKDLILSKDGDKPYYNYFLDLDCNERYKVKYVGFETEINKIPKGTLIRVSLARWWKGSSSQERCYLQLSGWYFDTDYTKVPLVINETNIDDLPF